MLFVVEKARLQRVISIVRDDRTRKSQGVAGPFIRLEAMGEHVALDGNEVSAKFPATVYEPGVLFLRITYFRRLLKTITKQKFVTIQVMAEGLLVENIRMPLESNDMLLYADPDQAPRHHPSLRTIAPEPASKPKPERRQLPLWPSDSSDEVGDGREPRG